jgi:uncharacterized membrane protein YeaQ/YmgE (transglycosylase-associated protein family)
MDRMTYRQKASPALVCVGCWDRGTRYGFGTGPRTCRSRCRGGISPALAGTMMQAESLGINADPMNEFLTPALGLVGAVVGAVLALFLGRGRARAQVEGAVSRAEAAVQGDLALLRETADETRRTAQIEFDAQ